MGKHKQYSPEFKFKVVVESLQGQKTQAQVCRENNVADELVSRWRQEFLQRGPEIFSTAHTHSAEQERIIELERLVGQLTLELNILKKHRISGSLRRTETGDRDATASALSNRTPLCHPGLGAERFLLHLHRDRRRRLA